MFQNAELGRWGILLPPSQESFFSALAELPESQRDAVLSSFDHEELEAIEGSWQFMGRREQLPPPGDWQIWLMLCGRGWGKTRAGAESIHLAVQNGYRRVGLIGATDADVRDVMIQGESGLKKTTPKGLDLKHIPTNRMVKWSNGAIGKTYSSIDPDQLRGPQHDVVWCDEIAKWKNLDDTWANIEFGLRLGKQPIAIITTTPKARVRLLHKFIEEADTSSNVVITGGAMYENLENLPTRTVESLRDKYQGTRLGKQELEGVFLTELDGALWSMKLLEECYVRPSEVPPFKRVIIAVDPPISSDEGADEAGIIATAQGIDDYFYVLGDHTFVASPAQWAAKTITLLDYYEADLIVAEKNQGGEMVEHTLRSVDGGKYAPIKLIHASKGKYVRAEPIAALYEQRKVKHLPNLLNLEQELCMIEPGRLKKSPNRADALVYALTELKGPGKRAGVWGAAKRRYKKRART